MITSYSDLGYRSFADYTYDGEFYVLTSNTAGENGWETCVFANDPVSNVRTFESLLEQIYSKDEQYAKLTHKNLLYKWESLGHQRFLVEEDDYQIGEERFDL